MPVLRCRNVRTSFVVKTNPDNGAPVTTVIRKLMTSSPSATDAALAQCAGQNYNTVQFSYMNCRSALLYTHQTVRLPE
jgi:hypothetical protein